MSLLTVRRRVGRPGPPAPGNPVPGNLRAFTSPEWAFLLGPQVVPGTYSATGQGNMESSLTARVTEFQDRCTSVAGFVVDAGTLSVTNGSADFTVSGGTSLTGKTGWAIRVADAGFGDGYRYFLIHSVQSATQGKFGFYNFGAGSLNTTNWQGTTGSGLAFALQNNATDGSGNAPSAFNATYNYYDTVLALYQAWAKVDNQAGGSSLLTSARAMADHMADTASSCGWVLPGSLGLPDTAPRNAAMLGFACRALDGKSHWFTSMANYTTTMSDNYLLREAIGGNRAGNASLNSVREAAYCQMFNAVLGVIHPNTTTRNQFRDKAIAYAVDPILRKKNVIPNGGGIRWKNMQEGATGEWVSASDGVTPVDFCQPFINSLMIEALIWTHRMMRFHGITGTQDYTDIGDAIVQAVRGWYAGYQQASNGFPANMRCVPYNTGDAGQKRNGVTTFVEVDPPGGGFAIYATPQPGNPTYPTDWDYIVEGRQLNADGVGNIGYAHALSPGSEFADMYHEVLSSCFEFQASPSSTYGSLWYAGQSQKNWNQHHRGCQKASGWITSGLEVFS